MVSKYYRENTFSSSVFYRKQIKILYLNKTVYSLGTFGINGLWQSTKPTAYLLVF